MDRVSGVPDAPGLNAPLPGRERELRELAGLLQQTAQGHGRILLLSGEAGIGKTTLCERLTRQAARDGTIVVTGYCYDLTTGRPFAPWREIFKSLSSARQTPSVLPLSPQDQRDSNPGSQDELFEHVLNALRDITRECPLLVVLEDIHWADSASLDLLRFVARQVSGLPLLLVATYRADEPDQSASLAATVPNIVREAPTTRIELGPLSRHDVASFVGSVEDAPEDPASRDTLATYLHARSEGNPFFMIELFREVNREEWHRPDDAEMAQASLDTMPVPSLIRQVIESRVRQLSEESRSFLNVAAVIGQDVPIELWQHVSGADDQQLITAIEEAAGRYLLRDTGSGARVRFIHGLVQETLYQSQVALRRRALHRQVAEALASQPVSIPEAVAHHFELAGDARAIEWLVQVGYRAQQIHAARDAIRAIDRAAALGKELGTPLPREAWRIRAMARETLGEIELARNDYEFLLKLASSEGDRTLESQTLIDLGFLWSGLDYQQAGEFLFRALDLLREVEDPPLYARCLNRIGNWQANTGQTNLDDVITMHQEALAIFEESDDHTGVAETLDLLGMTCYLAGQFGQSATYTDSAVTVSRRRKDKPRLLTSLTALAVNGGDFDVGFDAGVAASREPQFWIACCEEALAIAREAGWASDEAFTLTMLASLVSVRGDPGRGLQLASEAHKIAQRIGHQQWGTASSLILGRIWSELLDWHRGEYYLERSRNLARAMNSHFWTVLTTSALAILHAETGRQDLGLPLLEPFIASQGAGRSNTQRAFQFALSTWKLAAGAPAQALEIADALIALEEGSPRVRGVPMILKLRAEALRKLNRLQESEQAYIDALQASEVLEHSLNLWKIQISYGALLLELGRNQDAQKAFRSADSIATEIASTINDPAVRNQFLKKVQQRIAAANKTPGAQGTNVAGLSPREIEVLRLVALGLTDAQVGERLFISPRTVARHLQSIYTKLHVRSRTAAAAFAYEHDLVS